MNLEEFNPIKILKSAGLRGNDVFADFGCGPGIFSVAASQITSNSVYAFDIQQSALDSVVNQIHIHNARNIIPKRVNLEKIGGSGLEDSSVDFVLIRKILLQNDDKILILKEAFRILKNNGILLVIGWTENAKIGPEKKLRLNKEKVIDLASSTGFLYKNNIVADSNHYILLFNKN